MSKSTQALIEAINKAGGGLVRMQDARKHYPGFGFNVIVWAAVEEGAVAIIKHHHHAMMSQEEKDNAIRDGDDLYHAITIRN